eukprot:22965-Rhodomonas_salina.1
MPGPERRGASAPSPHACSPCGRSCRELLDAGEILIRLLILVVVLVVLRCYTTLHTCPLSAIA